MIQWRQDARKLATFLGTRSGEERDRVLTAQSWGFGQEPVSDDPGLRPNADGLVFGCVMEHVAGGSLVTRAAGGHVYETEFSAFLERSVASTFDRLCRERGLARVVAFCKKRASRHNRISLSASPSQIVEQGMGAEVGAD